MKKPKSSTKINKLNLRHKVLAVLLVGLFATTAIITPLVQADKYQEQIDALNAENSQKQAVQGQLGAEANSLSETINKLQADINALQAKINENQKKSEELKAQIVAAEAELAKQKVLLGQTIKSMYLQGEITTVEMLASSKDLSDFFDKQQYQENVRSKIKTTVDKITQLKLDLNTQKETLEAIIKEQQVLQGQLASQRAENDRLLGLNQSQQNELDNQIKANSSKVSELRKQQAAENAKHFNGARVVSQGNCGGGYPADAVNPSGEHWGCSYSQDNAADNWGMYNRECVSYTAWKVASSGRFMPYWGGSGNANQWDGNARAAGIPVDGNPRPGDVAIAHWGAFGHAMYVESVHGSMIHVSQYNWDYNGTYSETDISTAGLYFIHF